MMRPSTYLQRKSPNLGWHFMQLSCWPLDACAFSARAAEVGACRVAVRP